MSEIKQVNVTHDYQGANKVTGIQEGTTNSDAVNKGQMDTALNDKQGNLTGGSGVKLDGDTLSVDLSSSASDYSSLTLTNATNSNGDLSGSYIRLSYPAYLVYKSGTDGDYDLKYNVGGFSAFYKDNGNSTWDIVMAEDTDGTPNSNNQWSAFRIATNPITVNSDITDYVLNSNEGVGGVKYDITNGHDQDGLSRKVPTQTDSDVDYGAGASDSFLSFDGGKLKVEVTQDAGQATTTNLLSGGATKTYIDEQDVISRSASNNTYSNASSNYPNNPTNVQSALEQAKNLIDNNTSNVSGIQTVNTTQSNQISAHSTVIGVSNGDTEITSWASGTNYDELTLSGMSNSDYNGVYEYVKNGYVSGGTYSLDTDDQAIYKQDAGNGNFRVIYSNDSSGFFVNEFDSDPSGWSGSVTSVGSSETVSGYNGTVNGIYYPNANDAKVTYATLSTSFFLLGKTNVRDGVQAAAEGAVTALTVTGTVLGLSQGDTDFGSGFTILPNNADAKTLFQATETEFQALAEGSGATWSAGIVQVVEDTNNINISNPATDTFGGITLAQGEVLLLNAQTDDTENGFYVFDTTSTALVRWADADETADFIQNRSVQISSDGTVWAYDGGASPILGTDTLTFKKIRDSIVADLSVSEAKLTTTLADKLNAKSNTYQESCSLVANVAYEVNHNLGNKYPNITTWGDTDRVEEYSITAVDTTKFTITSSSNEVVVVTVTY